MPNEADIEMANRRGWAAYINGRNRADCPYEDGPERNAWLQGFDLSSGLSHAILF